MRPALVLLACAWLGAAPWASAAGLTQAELDTVGVRTAADARVPLAARVTTEGGRRETFGDAIRGRPTLLVFADYRCTTLCGPALSIVAAGLETSGLTPGRALRLVTLGLDPADSPQDARRFADARLGDRPALRADTTALVGEATTIDMVARSLGYNYLRNAADGQYIHPVAAFMLDGRGRVARVLSEVTLRGPDIVAAYTLARNSERPAAGGGLMAAVLIICHALTPSSGVYDKTVVASLRAASVITLAGMVGLGVVFVRRKRTA